MINFFSSKKAKLLENYIGFKEVNGVLIVLNTLTSEYFLFNGIEKLILWNIIQSHSDEEILKNILDCYDTTLNVAKKDLNEFKSVLFDKKILMRNSND